MTDLTYKKALEDAAAYNPVGFRKGVEGLKTSPELFGAIVSQNNFIIQLLLNLHLKVDTLEAENKAYRREKGVQAETGSSAETLEAIRKQLEGLSLKETKPKETKKGTLYTFKDPYVILQDEKSKLKK